MNFALYVIIKYIYFTYIYVMYMHLILSFYYKAIAIPIKATTKTDFANSKIYGKEEAEKIILLVIVVGI